MLQNTADKGKATRSSKTELAAGSTRLTCSYAVVDMAVLATQPCPGPYANWFGLSFLKGAIPEAIPGNDPRNLATGYFKFATPS